MAKKIIIFIIKTYQKILSPDTGLPNKIGVTRSTCQFFPTCSNYTIQAIEKYGTFLGLYKGFRRIIRCHPWQKNHIDPLV
ncbi:membrane protein insertion efficiency factor YidD [Patescibacteria group bacterium]|nr:membrane protein insertion efficiency factor YidD [Patescibacteria group bacterium]MBU1246584.1 membrane protein insertion efficiency factor YidD [Patescibacteria group bacterium]MBU1519185.1 membrane protein insertion efficiency factor YidD [Patescibacteria group bacterium]MBU1729944.1 membrane protein insertion efficiency factor YidD [Patescibacteria group bacterium]MBU1956171.1 membrane protein insertion efficiency factor YidD [Patescibacteria group bacterium]